APASIFSYCDRPHPDLHSFPTRRSSDLFHIDDEVIAHTRKLADRGEEKKAAWQQKFDAWASANPENKALFDRLAARELPEAFARSEEHTSELQSRFDLVCRLLLEKKNKD